MRNYSSYYIKVKKNVMLINDYSFFNLSINPGVFGLKKWGIYYVQKRCSERVLLSGGKGSIGKLFEDWRHGDGEKRQRWLLFPMLDMSILVKQLLRPYHQ